MPNWIGLDTETLRETYVLSFSKNGNEDLGQAEFWAAHVVLPNDSTLCLDNQVMISNL